MPDARAVEVVAMLGDSVVGVKHCSSRHDGRLRPATRALFALAAVSLLAFVFAFWTAVDNAAYNQARYEYETTVLGKPGYSVRARPLPSGIVPLAFGGLLASIVAVTAALLRMREERQTAAVRIGTAPGVEFPVDGAPAAEFEMVAPCGGGFAFHFRGLDGEITTNGASTSLAELAAQGRTSISPIPDDAKIRVRVGATTFLVSSVEQPRRHAVPLIAIDSAFARTLAGTAGLAAMMMLFVLRIPIEAESARIELHPIEETTIHGAHGANSPDLTTDDEEIHGDDRGGTGRSMALDPGMMGNEDSQRAEGRYKIAARAPDPQLSREQAIEQARNAGIIGSAAIRDGSAFSSLTGSFDFSSGFDDTDISGGKFGDEAGEMSGGFGYARSSFGPGGGGTGWGSICAGDFGTIGHGAGTGSGYGLGGGRCGSMCRGRVASVPTVSIGQPMAIGDMDKAIIRRYIKRHLDKITYCYEKQLLAKPDLSGTVSTQFFIAATGTVMSASAEGVDPEVARCVAGVIEAIQFPKSDNGGGVQVTYPFTFRPASGS